jgi:cytoskeletal protein RodZ
MSQEPIGGEPRRKLISSMRFRVALAAAAVLAAAWLAIVGQLKAGDDPFIKETSKTKSSTGASNTTPSTETSTTKTSTTKTNTTKTNTSTTNTSTTNTATTNTSTATTSQS